MKGSESPFFNYIQIMAISKIEYKGDLRCEAEHLRSQQVILTDAPLDNEGKGEAFSPTDLMATSLGLCMVTIMGIKARSMGLDIEGTQIEVEKIMASNPRRIAEIGLKFRIPHDFGEEINSRIEMAGRACPVAQTLNSEVIQSLQFVWGK